MLRFEEFKDIIAEDIINFLPDYYANATVTLEEVTKNNDTQLTGLVIKGADRNIAPTIYIDSYFERYMAGGNMRDIMQDIADLRVVYEMSGNFDVSEITNFENVKDKIICKLVNAEMNEIYLADKPYTQIEDLAVIYSIALGEKMGGKLTVPITDNLINKYGISTEELHDIALHNLAKSQIEFKTMREVLLEMMFPEGISDDDSINSILPQEEEAPYMYVLSNKEKLNGAAAVLDSKTMEDISQKLGGDFIVLPSSLHEVIIIPISENIGREEFENMIRDINAGQVEPEERLSDHVYQYDSVEHELVRMDKMEERQKQRSEEHESVKLNAKEEKKQDRERISMKDKLVEKKAEAVKNEEVREKPLPTQTKATALE
jgi:hypothetical protein